MSTPCTRCDGTGFLNTHQLPDYVDGYDQGQVTVWIKTVAHKHDVKVCDCCGDGEDWYGTPGEHYNADDPQGSNGPYASNSGLCMCH